MYNGDLKQMTEFLTKTLVYLVEKEGGKITIPRKYIINVSEFDNIVINFYEDMKSDSFIIELKRQNMEKLDD